MTHIILSRQDNENKFSIIWDFNEIPSKLHDIVFVLICEYKRYLYILMSLCEFYTEANNYIGDAEKIKELFIDSYKNFKGDNTFDKRLDDILARKDDEKNIDEEFKKLRITSASFANWQEDRAFGGNKKLIKILCIRNEENSTVLEVEFIQIYTNSRRDVAKGIYIYDNSDKSAVRFIKNIHKNKVIEESKIYDINDEKFVQSVTEYKKQIDVILLPEFDETLEEELQRIYKKGFVREWVENLFQTNIIINGKYICRLSDGKKGKIYKPDVEKCKAWHHCCYCKSEDENEDAIDIKVCRCRNDKSDCECDNYDYCMCKAKRKEKIQNGPKKYLVHGCWIIKLVPVYDKVYQKDYLDENFPYMRIESYNKKYVLANRRNEYLCDEPIDPDDPEDDFDEDCRETNKVFWSRKKYRNEIEFRYVYKIFIKGIKYVGMDPHTEQIIAEMVSDIMNEGKK